MWLCLRVRVWPPPGGLGVVLARARVEGSAVSDKSRKQRGHETETAVAAWFKVNGWPYAEPVGAGRDGTDVTGMPGLLVEVKARRDFRPVEWLRQHALNVLRVWPFVVWRPDGMGPAAVGSWGVMMRLDDFTSLLHEAGYGTRED